MCTVLSEAGRDLAAVANLFARLREGYLQATRDQGFEYELPPDDAPVGAWARGRYTPRAERVRLFCGQVAYQVVNTPH